MFFGMKNEESTYAHIERLLSSGNGPGKKRELGDDLIQLLAQLPQQAPHAESPDYEQYQQIQQKIDSLKQKMAEKHRLLMEDLQAQETFSAKFKT